jgi:hypothetical protein
MALELRDHPAAREGAGQPERRLDHLRPAQAEPHQLSAGNKPLELSGQLELCSVLARVELPPRQAGRDGVDHSFGGMPQDVRSHAQRIVEVHVPVHVVQPRTFASLEAERDRLAAQPEVAADPTGQGGRGLRVMSG